VLALVAAAAAISLLGPSAALDGTGEGTGPGARTHTLLRTVMFAALCVHVGELLTARLVRRVPELPDGPMPRPWSPTAAAAGMVAALGLAAIVANGNRLPQSLAELDPGSLYGNHDGTLALLEVNGFLVAWLCSMSRRPQTAALPLAVVIVAEALRAHPEQYTPLLGSALTLVHLTCAALWTGGLLHVLRTMARWRASPTAAAGLLGLYARFATVLFAALTVTGVASTLRRLPMDAWLTTAYGRVLLAKLLLVAVIAALAVTARRRLRREPDPWAAMAPARAEVWVLFAVVALSALLTAVPVPFVWGMPWPFGR
ncbi:CopD family protein, partial [Streptomyces sparsus]